MVTTVRTWSRLASSLRSFAASRSGVSAVEFALILPVMMLLYAGVVELSEALAVDRKVNRVASTVGDLVAQAASLSSSDFTNVFNASAAIMEPYSTTTIEIDVIIVDVTSSTQTVACSKTRNGTTYAAGATTPITVPSSIAVSGTQTVISRVSYTYTSPFSSFMQSVTGKDHYDLEHTYMLRPRLGSSITCT